MTPPIPRDMAQQLYSYALRCLRNTADAEDAVADTMFKVLTKMDQLAEERARTTWIWTVHRNVVTDMIRRSYRSREVSMWDDPPEITDRRAERELESVLDRRILEPMIRDLPPAYRGPVEAYLSGCTAAQGAESLGVSVLAYKNALFRGLQRLRRRVSEAA